MHYLTLSLSLSLSLSLCPSFSLCICMFCACMSVHVVTSEVGLLLIGLIRHFVCVSLYCLQVFVSLFLYRVLYANTTLTGFSI